MSRFVRVLIAAGAAVGLAAFGLTASAGAASAMTPVTVQISADPGVTVCGNYWGLNYTDRTFTATKVSAGKWDVKTSDTGIWLAWSGERAPLDSSCSTSSTSMGDGENGPLTGSADFIVTGAAGPPSAANERYFLKYEGATTYVDGRIITVNGNVNGQPGQGGTTFTDLVANLFPNPMGPNAVDVTVNSYSWTYTYPRTGEVMVQSSTGNTDTPVGIFTNGGLGNLRPGAPPGAPQGSGVFRECPFLS
jgi:hypothetical protein